MVPIFLWGRGWCNVKVKKLLSALLSIKRVMMGLLQVADFGGSIL